MLMNKHLLLTIALFGAASLANAQSVEPDAMKVEKTSSVVTQIKLDDVQRITFSDDESQMNVQTADKTQTFDIAEVARITFGAYEEESTGTETSTRKPQKTTFAVSASDVLTVSASDGIVSLRLVGVSGESLLQQSFDGVPTSASVQLPALAKGIYVVVVETTVARVSQKVIINK